MHAYDREAHMFFMSCYPPPMGGIDQPPSVEETWIQAMQVR